MTVEPRLIGLGGDPGRVQDTAEARDVRRDRLPVARVRHATLRPWEIRLLARASRRVKG